MPLTVRPAVVSDAATIVAFNQLLAEESEGKRLDAAKLTAGVTSALADPDRKGPYFLAELEGAAVGTMQVTFEWSDWRNGWFWWIQSVYVRPEFRRQGVFRGLFEHVFDAANADPEVIGIRLYVERDNHAAHKTYESMGLDWTTYQVMERYPL